MYFRNRVCGWTRYLWWGSFWRKCCHGDSVMFVALLCCIGTNGTGKKFFAGAAESFPFFPKLVMCRQRRRWIMRRDKNALSLRVILCHYCFNSHAQLSLETATGTENCSSRPSTMLMINSIEETLSLVPQLFLFLLNFVWDHFPIDTAIAPVNATGYQLVALCLSIGAEDRSHISDPLMKSKFLCDMFHSFLTFSLFILFFLFTVLDTFQHQLGQRVAPTSPHVLDTSENSWDESEASQPRWPVRSKRTYKTKKAWCADEKGWFFVTGATDAVGKPRHFYCRICWKDVSMLTNGLHEVLRYFQFTKHFPLDQRLRLETPGWWVLEFEGNSLNDDELELQRERILRGSLVIKGSRVSLCRGSHFSWIWDPRCYNHIASPYKVVIADWSDAIGRPLRASSPALGTIHPDRQPCERWCDMVPRWGSGC